MVVVSRLWLTTQFAPNHRHHPNGHGNKRDEGPVGDRAA